VLECWSAGVLECWSGGVLECWSDMVGMDSLLSCILALASLCPEGAIALSPGF
jgi:hypothetical protein